MQGRALTRTLPNANRALHFRATLTTFNIHKSTAVKVMNNDVGDVAGLTKVMANCKQGLPWHSTEGFHQVNKKVPTFQAHVLCVREVRRRYGKKTSRAYRHS
jgi:hypothetical protein